jgi:hypothetical protein
MFLQTTLLTAKFATFSIPHLGWIYPGGEKLMIAAVKKIVKNKPNRSPKKYKSRLPLADSFLSAKKETISKGMHNSNGTISG